jgi:hypothetical protein
VVGREREGTEVAKEALTAISQIHHEEARALAEASVALALSMAGETQFAFEVAHGMAAPLTRWVRHEGVRDEVLEKVFTVYIRAGKVEEAADIVGGIRNEWVRSKLRDDVATALLDAGRAALALDVARQGWADARTSRYDSLRRDAFARLARVLVKAGRSTEVMEAASAVEGLRDRLYAFLAAAEALAEAGRVAEGAEAVREARRLVYELPELRERFKALGDVSETLARIGRSVEAADVARGIEDRVYRAYALYGVTRILLERRR